MVQWDYRVGVPTASPPHMMVGYHRKYSFAPKSIEFLHSKYFLYKAVKSSAFSRSFFPLSRRCFETATKTGALRCKIILYVKYYKLNSIPPVNQIRSAEVSLPNRKWLVLFGLHFPKSYFLIIFHHSVPLLWFESNLCSVTTFRISC